MITLCGIALSNYDSKVKLVLLEKGLPFTEEPVKTGSGDEAVLAASPLGKIPFIRVDGQTPYVAGDTFTMADCAAWASLPVVGMATKAVLGEDLLLAAGVDWKGYADLIKARPSAARVIAERKAG